MAGVYYDLYSGSVWPLCVTVGGISTVYGSSSSSSSSSGNLSRKKGHLNISTYPTHLVTEVESDEQKQVY